MDPLLLHVAFSRRATSRPRAGRLLEAGAKAVGEVTTTPGGDELAMLRDPWGLALQLARRKLPLVTAVVAARRGGRAPARRARDAKWSQHIRAALGAARVSRDAAARTGRLRSPAI